MNKKKAFFGRLFLATLGAFITILLGSCFCPGQAPCDAVDSLLNAKPGKLTSSDRKVVFEDPGTIIAYHGYGCAESDQPGSQNILKVEQSLELPRYATNATVFLNGWHLNYLHGDEHVAGLGTVIGDISVRPETLTWQAAGLLGDQNFDNPYKWCYTYTAIAWNPSKINLTVDQKDGSCDLRDHREANLFDAENEGTTTALASFPSFLHDPEFASSKVVVILPRGFGFEWNYCETDHHLLQLAYNLDHSEIFIENGKVYKKKDQDVTPSLPDSASQVDSGYVSWETSTIFKDNDTRRNYQFGEIVSGLGGSDVGVIQPPFSILPTSADNSGTTNSQGVRTKEFIIGNVPFEYVIPMLTGWDLDYLSSDQHVEEIGIWIDDIHYDKDPNAPTGILRYKLSSVLRDNDNWPDFYARHKVTILGLRPTAGSKRRNQQSPEPTPSRRVLTK
jgi:hypothetical protein